MAAHAAFARNAEEFVERLEDVFAFAAHVAGINAPVCAGDFGQLHNLLGLREGAGQVNQPRRQSDRAILHRLRDVAFHDAQFGVRRRTQEGAAHRLPSHGVVADERADVGGDVRGFELLEILTKVQPRAAAVAEHEGRDAHAEKILGPGLVFDALGVRVGIDESGGDDQSAHLHAALCCALHPAHRHDPSVAHCHIGEHGRVARAIRYPSAAQEQIEILGGESGSEQNQTQGGCDVHGRVIAGAGGGVESCPLAGRIRESP